MKFLPFIEQLKNLGKKTTYDTFFTIDIGSSSIKCIAYKYDQTLEIIGSAEESISPDIVRAGNIIDKQKVIEAVDNVIYNTMQDLEESVDNVIYCVSEDLVTSTVTTVRINRPDKSIPISKRELEEIHKKVLDTAFESANQEILKKRGDPDPEIDIIALSDVYAKVEDNRVDSLEGLFGKKIELAIYTAFAPTGHIKTLEEISKTLDLKIKALTPNMYALTQATKRIKADKSLDGIIIDIGKDSTKVGIIFSGGVTQTNTVNIGGKHFTEAIALDKGLTIGEAEKIKVNLYTEEGNQDYIDEIESSMEETLNIWLDALQIMFTEFDGIKTFPTDVYLLGEGSKLKMLRDELANAPWTKSIPFKSPPEYHELDIKNVNFVQDVNGEALNLNFFNVLAASTIYYEIIKENE